MPFRWWREKALNNLWIHWTRDIQCLVGNISAKLLCPTCMIHVAKLWWMNCRRCHILQQLRTYGPAGHLSHTSPWRCISSTNTGNLRATVYKLHTSQMTILATSLPKVWKMPSRHGCWVNNEWFAWRQTAEQTLSVHSGSTVGWGYHVLGTGCTLPLVSSLIWILNAVDVE